MTGRPGANSVKLIWKMDPTNMNGNTAQDVANRSKSSPWLTLSVYLLVALNSLDWLISVETLTPETELNPIMALAWGTLGFAGFTIIKLVFINMAIVLVGLLDLVKTLWVLNAVYIAVILSHVIGAL